MLLRVKSKEMEKLAQEENKARIIVVAQWQMQPSVGATLRREYRRISGRKEDDEVR